MRQKLLDQAAELHTRALDLRGAGNLRAAEAACRQAARLFERCAGKASADAAHAEVEWAEMVELRGDLAGAATLLARASRRLSGHVAAVAPAPEILDLSLRARMDAARVAQLRGRYRDADKRCRATLLWARAHQGRGRVAAALTALGVLRKAQGRYAEALALYRQAMVILRAQRGPRAGDLATLYHNLAGSEHARGRFAVAEEHARRGLAIRRRAFGPDDPGVIADEAALAPILDGLGKRAEAERLYLRALAYYLRRYGRASYEVAVTLANLGALCRNRGDLAQAEGYLRRGLAIEETLLGPRHPELALSLSNLGNVLAARGQRRAARTIYQRALRIFAASVGPRHPHFLGCKRNLHELDQD